MTVNRSLVAALALIAAIATFAPVGAGTAAPTTAGPFELTIEYQVPPWEVPSTPLTGTFAAQAPFCRSGTFVGTDLGASGPKYRFTCDDGSGSVVASASVGLADLVDVERLVVDPGSFRIVEGTGRYLGLRGKGSMRSEILHESVDPDCVSFDEFGAEWCPWITTWRITLEGVAAEDAVAPAVSFSSVKVTKVQRPAGAYSLDLTIALRDEVEGNPISYLLRVTPATSARELASSSGTTQAGTASMTMRTPQVFGLRSMLLRLTASDEVGNESSVSQVVRLPR